MQTYTNTGRSTPSGRPVLELVGVEPVACPITGRALPGYPSPLSGRPRSHAEGVAYLKAVQAWHLGQAESHAMAAELGQSRGEADVVDWHLGRAREHLELSKAVAPQPVAS